jgi:photosystem II stability/assembly factor-like uncharacterized protein
MRPRRTVPATLALLLLLAPGYAAGQGFHAIHTQDGRYVLAAGDGGAVYRSFDGGATWSATALGTRTLRDLAGSGPTLIAAADSGQVWMSADRGGNWTPAILPGAPDLAAVAIPRPGVAVVVGAGGTIARSADGGATWSARTSGTAQDLNAVAFADSVAGWAAGDGGVLLRTSDGGDTWNATATGTSNDLLSVSQAGDDVWVVGARGAALRSTDGGANFAPVDLKLDARAAVRVVRMLPGGVVWLAGGGGFLRRSSDGGATWSYPQHRVQAPITDLAVRGDSAWATNAASRVVTYSHGGAWQLPAGAGVSLSWGTAARYSFSGTARGSTLGQSPRFEDVLYAALGNKVVRSPDAGETWRDMASLPAGVTKVNAFLISPKDTTLWVAAVGGSSISDRIVRSTDAGANWTTTLTADFGEYGIPLEMDPDHPDTLWFGGETASGGSPPTTLRRSSDFGATWSPYGTATFRSPCDLIVVPDSTNLILLGDGVTGTGRGEFWKSTDGGQNFTMVAQMPTGASEIPGMATSRLRNSAVLGTNWGSGGVRRSTNYGSTWTQVDATASAWGIDIARDDPNLVMFGRYSGAGSLISTDGGTSWTTVAVPSGWGNNYGLYLRDRGTILCEQSSGLWKLTATHSYTPVAPAQVMALVAPNSGEMLAPGSAFDIVWDSEQIAMARIEFRRGPAEPWEWIADVAGFDESFAWTVPFVATSQAQVRVSDAWDGVPADSSAGTFTILAPSIAVSPESLDFGEQAVGTSTPLVLTVANDGTAPLAVGPLAVASPVFRPGRSTFVVPANAQDTVAVWFEPVAGGVFADTLVIASDDLARTPFRVPLAGSAPVPATLTLLSPNGGEVWQYGTTRAITWAAGGVTSVAIDWRAHPDSAWTVLVTDLIAVPSSYDWTVPFAPTTGAAVRVRDMAGAAADSSEAPFSLTSPLFACVPDTLRLPVVALGGWIADTLRIENPGTAPLTIDSVQVGHAEFRAGRTSLVVPPGGSDTVAIVYEPVDEGRDTVVVSFVTDAPFGPFARVVTAFGASPAAAGAAATGAAFTLFQNLPNPFRGGTVIRYALPVAADVELEVFDLRGNRVATLVHARQGAGRHSVTFAPGAGTADGAALLALRSGVYFYRLRAGGRSATRKMLLIQ